MSADNNSKKQALKSSAIVGSASFLAILIRLVNVKVLSELLGPTGIGLMGILATMMGLGGTLFGMGLSASGVRELAINNSIEKLALVRKALFSANLLLGLLAIFLIVFFKQALSLWFFETSDYQYAILIIAFGVFLSLISGSQTALLQGLRKISELAKVNVIGALVTTFIGLLTVWFWGQSGIPFLVITLPLVTCLTSFYYIRQLPKVTSASINLIQLSPQWRSMLKVGFAFMLAGLMGVGCQLIVRYIINQQLNLESVGYFQAAWQISMTYISFVLGAMAVDYYPRLTQQIHNKNEANRLVNEQTELAIAFAAPVLISMLAFAPFVINLLYSSEFGNSVEILRWQVFGDALKIMSWPLGFIMLAKGRSKLFFWTEFLWNASYITFVYSGIELFGIEITGYAFAASYVIYLLTVYAVSRSINDFRWEKSNIRLMMSLTLATASLLLASYFSILGTIVLGIFLLFISIIYALKLISGLGVQNRKLKKILYIYKRCASALGFKGFA